MRREYAEEWQYQDRGGLHGSVAARRGCIESFMEIRFTQATLADLRGGE